ncbi:MAG: hypothetical protein IKD10_06895 [Lentisphaeria bacterium]|nr:hypothetical protein [Lentisphaerota bacterium]MBR7144651.1 hypothetical protein [Lentisphaeria bacterium]
MCNMAAYAGNEPAAPKLFRMLQSQETLGGGHYNGIATIHNGKIHMIKVIGSTADLLKRHPEVLDLPGTVGIAHSRTPGIDSDEWAQPFFSYDEKVVYCANGDPGQFKDTDYNDFYRQSLADGMSYRTSIDEAATIYPVMSDGKCIHFSEIMANIIRSKQLKTPVVLRKLLRKALTEFKAEVAALALSESEPDAVSAIRINQPLMWGRDNSGFYLATSAFALENEKLQWINRVPHASAMTMTKDNITFEAMDEFAGYFMDHEPLTAIFAEFENMLNSGNDFCVDNFCKAAKKCWPAGKMAVANMIAYEYLREKMASGVLETFVADTPGSGKGLTAPQQRYRKKSAL